MTRTKTKKNEGKTQNGKKDGKSVKNRRVKGGMKRNEQSKASEKGKLRKKERDIEQQEGKKGRKQKMKGEEEG